MKTNYLLYKIWRQERHKTNLPDWELRLVLAVEDTQVHINTIASYISTNSLLVRLGTVYSLNEVRCYRPLDAYREITISNVGDKFVKKCNSSKSALLFIEKRSR